jgi:sugar phosphate isomerase/epimerase
LGQTALRSLFEWYLGVFILPELKIAIALTSLRQPFQKALHTAANLGATGVEIDARHGIRPNELSETGRRQLRKMLSDLNLSVAAVRFPTRRGYDCLEDLDQRLQATKQAMSFAFSLGASVVINSAGFVPEKSDDPAYQQLRASLGELSEFGDKVGAALACETGTEPCERLAALLSDLQNGNIGIHFNPANLILEHNYQSGDIRCCANLVKSVAARDAVQSVGHRRGLEVSTGQGSAEFAEILGVLMERRFDGWYIVQRLETGRPIAELADSIAYLRRL